MDISGETRCLLSYVNYSAISIFVFQMLVLGAHIHSPFRLIQATVECLGLWKPHKTIGGTVALSCLITAFCEPGALISQGVSESKVCRLWAGSPTRTVFPHFLSVKHGFSMTEQLIALWGWESEPHGRAPGSNLMLWLRRSRTARCHVVWFCSFEEGTVIQKAAACSRGLANKSSKKCDHCWGLGFVACFWFCSRQAPLNTVNPSWGFLLCFYLRAVFFPAMILSGLKSFPGLTSCRFSQPHRIIRNPVLNTFFVSFKDVD